MEPVEKARERMLRFYQAWHRASLRGATWSNGSAMRCIADIQKADTKVRRFKERYEKALGELKRLEKG